MFINSSVRVGKVAVMAKVGGSQCWRLFWGPVEYADGALLLMGRYGVEVKP